MLTLRREPRLWRVWDIACMGMVAWHSPAGIWLPPGTIWSPGEGVLFLVSVYITMIYVMFPSLDEPCFPNVLS